MTKSKKKRKAICLILLTGLCMISCCMLASADSKHVGKVTVRIGNRDITGKTYQMDQGSGILLKTSVSPENAAGSISYRSSKKEVASVSKKGRVTAKRAGTARITVSVIGKDKKKTTVWVKIRVNNRQTMAYETQELLAQRGKNSIYGVAYVPQGGPEKKPVVIYSHGFG